MLFGKWLRQQQPKNLDLSLDSSKLPVYLLRMRFVLLGSGTSTGVPLPGCHCSVCSSAHPRNKRLRTSAAIILDSGRTILLDAGPDLRQQSLIHGITRVDAVIYTHAHADHILGTDDLRSFNFATRERIECYATEKTFVRLKHFFDYIFEQDGAYKGGMLAQLDSVVFTNESPFVVEGVTVTPFPLVHGNLEVTGVRIGELGYATDFKFLTPRAREVLMGVKYLFLDGLRDEPHPTHATIGDAVTFARELKAEQSYIIHTSHTVDYEKVNAQLPEGVELGYDGLTFTFSQGA
jgi:phosphoribosyl 1,2-cyclic phosphate phosphodiesterase